MGETSVRTSGRAICPDACACCPPISIMISLGRLWIKLRALLCLVLRACCLSMDAASCFAPAARPWMHSLFTWDYQPNQPASQQCFSLTKNQPAVHSASQISSSEQAGSFMLRACCHTHRYSFVLCACCRVRFASHAHARTIAPEGATFARAPLPRLLMKHLQHKAFAAAYVQNR
jgi:hypothetical protein